MKAALPTRGSGRASCLSRHRTTEGAGTAALRPRGGASAALSLRKARHVAVVKTWAKANKAEPQGKKLRKDTNKRTKGKLTRSRRKSKDCNRRRKEKKRGTKKTTFLVFCFPSIFASQNFFPPFPQLCFFFWIKCSNSENLRCFFPFLFLFIPLLFTMK